MKLLALGSLISDGWQSHGIIITIKDNEVQIIWAHKHNLVIGKWVNINYILEFCTLIER